MKQRRASSTQAGSVLPDLDETVKLATEGDQFAFVKLWQFFYPRLIKFLYSLTKDAEDICSEAWIKIAAAIKTFKGDGRAFVNWIYTIARNLAIDHLRAQNRRGPTDEVKDDDWVSEDQKPSDVTDLMRNLKSDEAEIVSLRVIAELDVPSVAAITGKSEANVRVITHRALNKLRVELQSAGGGV